MKTLLSWTLSILAAFALAATLLSLFPSNEWYIRAIDMVRQPILYLAIVSAVAAFFMTKRHRWITIGAFVAIAAVNFVRIWPYVPFAQTEIAVGDAVPDAACFSALSVNVKVKNDDHAAMIAQIDSVKPDLLLLMETDQTWADALQPVLSAYPHILYDLQPHAFGMMFASRLPVVSSEMIENTARHTPTLYATIELPDARAFGLIGLHPKPPIVGKDTDERDANILRAGTTFPSSLPDAVVMGDFNDVPWSRTSSRLRKVGDWRDPRIGRGTYPTFPASMTWIGWPLDHLMVKGDVTIKEFEIMPENGSDHRAIRAELCLAPEADPAVAQPAGTAD